MKQIVVANTGKKNKKIKKPGYDIKGRNEYPVIACLFYKKLQVCVRNR